MDVGNKGATERQLRGVLNAKGGWDVECEIILSPLQIFHYDRLSHALKMLVPGYKILLNPLTAYCYGQGCSLKNRCISLKRINDLGNFESHLLVHQDQWSTCLSKRLRLLQKSPFIDKKTLSDLEMDPLPTPSTEERNDCIEKFSFKRDLPVHYLMYWKHVMLSSGVINQDSLIYQSDDVLLEELLSFPFRNIANWDLWPVVKEYAIKFVNSVSEGQYALLSGIRKKRAGSSLEELEEYARDLNHVVPGYTTVASWQPPVTVQSSCHVHMILGHLEILKNRHGAVAIETEKALRYPVALCYDGQDINQGVFCVKRQSDSKLFLCGLDKMLSSDDLNEIGFNNFRKKLDDGSLSFVKEAKEFRACDIAGILSTNVATFYRLFIYLDISSYFSFVY